VSAGWNLQPKQFSLNEIFPGYERPHHSNDEEIIDGIKLSIHNGDELPPILVDSSGLIEDGNHRYFAAREEGVDSLRGYDISGVPKNYRQRLVSQVQRSSDRRVDPDWYPGQDRDWSGAGPSWLPDKPLSPRAQKLLQQRAERLGT
jgi:hypothetical protein